MQKFTATQIAVLIAAILSSPHTLPEWAHANTVRAFIRRGLVGHNAYGQLVLNNRGAGYAYDILEKRGRAYRLVSPYFPGSTYATAYATASFHEYRIGDGRIRSFETAEQRDKALAKAMDRLRSCGYKVTPLKK